MSEKYNISTSPHIRSKATTNNIMLMVALALMPATVFGVFNFGINALILIIVTTGTCIATEYLYQKYMNKKITIKDGSALLTGLLLALNLPANAPWWIGVVGGVVAILLIKQVFGGLGQNVMNPALGARCFLLISFTGIMTDFTYHSSTIDAITTATPLAELREHGALVSYEFMDLIIGNISGTIGETSVIAILIGAGFLIYKGIIDLRIPASYLLSFLAFIIIFGGHGIDPMFIGTHLFGGGLMLGVFFMATDYVTSPITKQGQLVYGVCLGVLTGVFRIFGASAEGVSYAIIFCNLLVPLIEKVTLPKPFGKGGEK
ncbi:MAG: NADH:ubiquinone oxidoreductase [Epulopiscium sp. Nuni2H_MBin003]|nr:MAG: NADH:ubiquinone oxidoreductase [Epulopiscium sp. Nuni2H_MBin003]